LGIFKKGPLGRSSFTTITALYLDFGATRFMDPDTISAIRRELFYHDFMLHYLQEEQKKRSEELRILEEKQKKWLDELKTMEQDLEKLRADPKIKKLLELAEANDKSRSRSKGEHGEAVRSVRRGRLPPSR